MHKGRQFPQLVPQCLSIDCVVPEFYPQQMRPIGSFTYGFSVKTIPDGLWAASVIDLDRLGITSHGEFDAAGDHFLWRLTYRVNGTTPGVTFAMEIDDTGTGRLWASWDSRGMPWRWMVTGLQPFFFPAHSTPPFNSGASNAVGMLPRRYH